jgi:hypothetical protein
MAMLGVLLVTHLVGKSALEREKKARGPDTLEGKLRVLEKYGLRLAKPFTVDSLLAVFDRDEYEKPGYGTVLVGLGTAEDEEPFRQHSENLWHTDFECIEEEGDYKAVVERMVEMSRGSLVLTEIEDGVDRTRGEALLSFAFKGERISYQLELDGDYVDFSLFEELADLLNRSDPSKVFVYYDLGGYDGVFGCVTEEQYRGLKSEGIRFRRL